MVLRWGEPNVTGYCYRAQRLGQETRRRISSSGLYLGGVGSGGVVVVACFFVRLRICLLGCLFVFVCVCLFVCLSVTVSFVVSLVVLDSAVAMLTVLIPLLISDADARLQLRLLTF